MTYDGLYQNRRFACKLSCCFLQFSPTFTNYACITLSTINFTLCRLAILPGPWCKTRHLGRSAACTDFIFTVEWWRDDLVIWYWVLELTCRTNQKLTIFLTRQFWRGNYFCANILIHTPTCHCTFSILKDWNMSTHFVNLSSIFPSVWCF